MNDATRIFGIPLEYGRDGRRDHTARQPNRRCHRLGCPGEAIHKAPAAPEQPNHTLWFCREHAREHNAKWDYFKGMSRAEIEHFRAEDTTGHRPTWKLGTNNGQLWQEVRFPDDHDIFGEPPHTGPKDQSGPQAPKHDNATREALSDLHLDVRVTWAEIKVRYKELVKRHHPDANGGSKKAENKLKHINRAYGILKTCYEH